MKRRTLLYLGFYVAIMAVAALFIPTWRIADWWIFALLNRGTAPSVAEDVVVVDVPYNTNLEMFRTQVTGLLKAMVNKPEALPKLVVLDIWISGTDDRGLPGLEQAIRGLQAAKVAVYAGVDPRQEQGVSGQLDPGYMARHAQRLYDLLDGKGHTRFDHLFGVAKYDPEVEISGVMGSEHLQALPVTIATNHYNRPVSAAAEPIVVKVGDAEELHRRTYTFRLGDDGRPTFTHYRSGGGGSPSGAEPDLRGKLVVVGSLDQDRTDFRKLSGPEILAFAISERILPSDSALQPKVLASPTLLLALVAGFAALAVALFWLLFRKLKRFRSRMWLVGLMSLGVCLLVLALWVSGLSRLNYAYPQVTLVGIGIIVSTGLSWFYTRRGLELKLIAPPTDKPEPGAEELPQYDVFISYARTAENLVWVKANMYERLLKESNADGSALRVFFDQRSIDPGEDFYKELALAIQGSRFFLPVYTSEYFTRPFCKFEMQRAALRHVQLGDFIVAIAREAVQIPIQFDHINYVDVKAAPDFMDRVVERIRKREKAQPGG